MKEREKKIFQLTTSSTCGQSKEGQVKLSFGMIFSVILIIIFIAFAFYAIRVFMGIGDTFSAGKFSDELQKDIDKLWKSSQGSQELEYSLPKDIEWVCFADLSKGKSGGHADFYEEFEKYSSDKNLFFYPVDSVELNGLEIEHVEFGGANPLCFENIQGKVKITLKKDFGEELVSVGVVSVSSNLPLGTGGIVNSDFSLNSGDGNLLLEIPAETGAFTEDGAPLTLLSIEVIDVSLDSSYSDVVGGVVYDLQPDGANFDEPISIELSYDEADLPEGFSENLLSVVLISNGVRETINDYIVDTVNNVITANILHFTEAAVVASGTCGGIGGTHCYNDGIVCDSLGFNSLGQTSDCKTCCNNTNTCGGAGGTHCFNDGTVCSSLGFDSLARTYDCKTCCNNTNSCGGIGGTHCLNEETTGDATCASLGFEHLARTYDCNECCGNTNTCGGIGGTHCFNGVTTDGTYSRSKGYDFLGTTSDCDECANNTNSCGGIGGTHCFNEGATNGDFSRSQGFVFLATTYDCQECANNTNSCGGIGGTNCYNDETTCSSLGFERLARTYDCNECCKSD